MNWRLKHKSILTLALGLAGALWQPSSKLWAQIALTEQQAIEQIRQNHPSVRSAQWRVQEKALLEGAAKVWEPTEFYHNITADPDYGMFGTTAFGFNQSLPARRLTEAQRFYYQRQKAMAEAHLGATQQQLLKSVRELYQHLSYIQSKAQLYRRLDSLYQTVAVVARRRYETGEASLAETLALEDKAAQIRLALETTDHEIAFDYIVLGQLLGLAEPVTPVVQPFERMSFSIGDTVLVENSAHSRYFKAAISVVEAEQTALQARRAPVFGGGLSVQFMPNGLVYPGWQVQMRLPLATGHLKSLSEAAGANLLATQAQYQTELLRQRSEMAHLLHEQEKYEIQLDYYEKHGKALADELLRNAVLNYRAGTSSFVEFAQAAEQAIQIELNYLENVFGLNMTIIELRLLTGR